MDYAIELLKSRQEEYETLLETLLGDLRRGTYRTKDEEEMVKSAVSEYKSRLIDISKALDKLNS